MLKASRSAKGITHGLGDTHRHMRTRDEGGRLRINAHIRPDDEVFVDRPDMKRSTREA
ncbi:hypothetical protein [Hyphomicrobium sp.]|uniref:hypothetical protein n=1 Tax=Hyphomicrobium sp. TaxID=82 RepID=UPI002E35100B|nr:hypothetical protein [Hyphomicrobium sp.]HEX2840460.1 hypothetical protein [Hyphomicrobium sp.]